MLTAVDGDGDLTVRVARLDDDPALVELERVSWSPLGDFPSTRGRVRTTVFNGEPADRYLVAELGTRLVGLLKLSPVTPLPENTHVLGIHGLTVAPEARGRGIGAALLAAADERARAQGARKISLRVLGHNAVARRLYERAGFVVDGVLREEFFIDGSYVDDVLMSKRLP